MSSLNTEILKYVIDKLEKMKIPTDKIVVQKLMFYLKENGLPISYDYDMYAYGPYSKKLNHDADGLAFDKQLIISNRSYRKGDNFISELTDKYKNKIDDQIDKFRKLVDDSFDFETMEIIGTTFYCYNALKGFGLNSELIDVLEEFKGWKGGKYPDSKIQKAYNKIKRFH